MLTRQKRAFLKIAIIFLAVVVIIIGIAIPSFAAQSGPTTNAKSSSEQKTVAEEKVGLLPVHVNGKYGFIDKTGKIIINPQFDWARDFKEGLAVVKIGGKYSFIDKTGKIVIKPQFDMAGIFHEGLAPVRFGYGSKIKWGYIDKTGRYIWKPTR